MVYLMSLFVVDVVFIVIIEECLDNVFVSMIINNFFGEIFEVFFVVIIFDYIFFFFKDFKNFDEFVV